MSKPLTVWARIKQDRMQPQVGDVLRSQTGELKTVSRISGEPGKSMEERSGMMVFYNFRKDNGEEWGAVNAQDDEYISRADGGPCVEESEATK